ncbi:MAG: hypothetical protein Q7T48_12775 [Cellvibrio sp.]|uniref:hypothetical protein n=1 Tax=Cellvibrio sp. TaxID=1965322 RepID=UPI0027180BDC|nr:hypothetical protein [Cellvibrio sp.]
MNLSIKLIAAGSLLFGNLCYADWYFRGTANGWATTPMRLVANNIWSTQIVLDGQTNQRF